MSVDRIVGRRVCVQLFPGARRLEGFKRKLRLGEKGNVVDACKVCGVEPEMARGVQLAVKKGIAE
jgi:hypothetical protein